MYKFQPKQQQLSLVAARFQGKGINMRRLINSLIITFFTTVSFQASASIIGGVNFPQGLASFADATSNFVNGSPSATQPHLNPNKAIGAPDYDGINNCADQTACTFLTLGSGGSIVFEFIDNYLTGSNNSDLDLWIFEVGPDVEDTFVEVSANGTDWTSVGKVFGSTSGIDVDAYGFDSTSVLAYVRLTDDPNDGKITGNTIGADIDAVGAITTVIVPSNPPGTPIPEPAGLFLLGLGLVATRQCYRK